ncbi:MAG: type II secretion system protein, partial [Gammaproteobacteria bacterium]
MQKQRGVTLLILAIVMALAAITYFLTAMSPAELKIDRQLQTMAVLKKAKQALVAHAITHSDQPGDEGEYGNLPCPDYTPAGFGEGVPDSPCGTSKAVTLGYYPWKAEGTGMDAFKDYAGNCLYYVTSPGYKITTTKVMLNEDSNGNI